MKPFLLFCCLALLIACDTPTREYAGIDPVRVHVDQSAFDVRQRGDTAQAIRLNTEWAPRPEAVLPRALVAIEQASGCEVTRMDGDQVIIEARLKCGNDAARAPRTLEYKCDYRVIFRGRAELTCLPGL
jgi:hypothetical protein